MANDPTVNQYLTNEVMSASPAKLRLLLLDGSIRFARQACAGLREKNFERSYEGFSQCRAIVLELMNTIRDELDPDLASRIRSLYAYIYRELVGASADKSPDAVDKVIELLEYERETWIMLMRQSELEQSTPQGTQHAVEAKPADARAADFAAGTHAHPHTPGRISFQA